MTRTVFQYEAVDAEGRLIKNQLEADTQVEAVKDLTRRDLYPVHMTAKSSETAKKNYPVSAPNSPQSAGLCVGAETVCVAVEGGIAAYSGHG